MVSEVVMSRWRDIWKKSLKANRLFSIDIEQGYEKFAELSKVYEVKEKDGMIHYAYAEAWEYRKEKQKALEEYKLAQSLFPVPHWKDVAQITINRLNANKTADEYFDKNDFNSLLWYTFQKVYEYVYLDDFVRYVCLSAISRADSEWPLSLVDFRSVLELQIKTTFPDIVQNYIDDKNYSLANIINELYANKFISNEISKAMHQIRKSGNAATHEMKDFDDENVSYINNENDSESLNYLLKILNFFNNYNRDHSISS